MTRRAWYLNNTGDPLFMGKQGLHWKLNHILLQYFPHKSSMWCICTVQTKISECSSWFKFNNVHMSSKGMVPAEFIDPLIFRVATSLSQNIPVANALLNGNAYFPIYMIFEDKSSWSCVVTPPETLPPPSHWWNYTQDTKSHNLKDRLALDLLSSFRHMTVTCIQGSFIHFWMKLHCGRNLISAV